MGIVMMGAAMTMAAFTLGAASEGASACVLDPALPSNLTQHAAVQPLCAGFLDPTLPPCAYTRHLPLPTGDFAE